MASAEAVKEDGNKMKWKDVQVLREGDKITLPEGMSFDEGIEWLRRKKEEDNRVIAVHEQVDAYPLDGAYALWCVISKKYGFAGLIPTPGFWRDHPPEMIGVATGPASQVQVPWGRMQIPNVSGYIETSVMQKEGRLIFVIGGEVQQRFKKDIAELAKLTRDYVRENSIYRAKAIRVSFPELKANEYNPTTNAPKFIDTSNVSDAELIFSKDVALLVKDSLFTPIEKTAQCRQYKVPLKRGILLEGPYGTGKTLTAYVTAQKAVNNGWTFIYLGSVKDLQRAIYFAQQYGPAVIFAEDIDTVMKGQRDDTMNGILNTIDGVDTKDGELMVVLTTNHVELISPAMLRPGRLDAVVPVRPPDAEAVGRLIKLYARDLIEPGADLTEAGKLLDQKIPAVIREVVERSKLAAIGRLPAGQELHLNGDDLVHAAKSMLAQIELVNPNHKEPPHPIEILGRSIGREMAVGQAITDKVLSTKEGRELFEKVLPVSALEAISNGQSAAPAPNGKKA